MSDETTPVVLATGQAIEREAVVDAVELAARAAGAALDSVAGARERVEQLTLVAVSFSPASPRAASETSARLGLDGIEQRITTAGGNAPQWAVNDAAEAIRTGRLSAALVCGAEATRSMRERDPGADFMSAVDAGDSGGAADPVVGTPVDGILGPAELAAKLRMPAEIYPLFESARAHAAGRDFAAQRAHVAPLMARFSQIAAKNPYAWLPRERSVEELATPSASNRLTAQPYTKWMNSFPNVDQASALLVTSLAVARALGAADRAVFIWSGATNTEPPPAQRPDPGRAPALRVAAQAALDAAGIGADDLALIDHYSCFPVAVEAAAEALGVQLDDARDLTVTGGMPFFGGPGNNYSGHGIASLVERLREVGGLGYVNANGGYLSKHSAGVYGTTPPPGGFRLADTREAQEQIRASARPVAENAQGDATVVAATIVHDRSGAPVRAPILAELDDGRRLAANAADGLPAALGDTCLVGTRVRVSGTTYEL